MRHARRGKAPPMDGPEGLEDTYTDERGVTTETRVGAPALLMGAAALAALVAIMRRR